MRVGHGRRGRAGRGLGPSELIQRELALERREARLCFPRCFSEAGRGVESEVHRAPARDRRTPSPRRRHRGRRRRRGGRTWAARPFARPRRRGSRRPRRPPTRPGFDQKSRRACLLVRRGRAFVGFFGASLRRSRAARPGAAASGGRRHYQNRSRRRLLNDRSLRFSEEATDELRSSDDVPPSESETREARRMRPLSSRSSDERRVPREQLRVGLELAS